MDNAKLTKRIEQLFLNGLHCSQIMLILSQELRGEEEPAVIAAMGGLAGGMGVGANCGTLTGGACMLSSYCARGSEEEYDKSAYLPLAAQLNDWFSEEFGAINCGELVSKSRLERMEKCPALMAKTFRKCCELLEENGISVDS